MTFKFHIFRIFEFIVVCVTLISFVRVDLVKKDNTGAVTQLFDRPAGNIFG